MVECLVSREGGSLDLDDLQALRLFEVQFTAAGLFESADHIECPCNREIVFKRKSTVIRVSRDLSCFCRARYRYAFNSRMLSDCISQCFNYDGV